MQSTVFPKEFIESLDEKKHLMLYYDDNEYAKLIEALFLKQGLECGESCIYATWEDSDFVIASLVRHGIPLESFLSGKIQIFCISPVSGTADEILSESKKQADRILSNVKKPIRIVCRIVTDISTKEGREAELEMERMVHHHFEDFGCMLMCPYEISSIEKKDRLDWVQSLFANHHVVIYAPKFDENGVISPCYLLEKCT